MRKKINNIKASQAENEPRVQEVSRSTRSLIHMYVSLYPKVIMKLKHLGEIKWDNFFYSFLILFV